MSGNGRIQSLVFDNDPLLPGDDTYMLRKSVLAKCPMLVLLVCNILIYFSIYHVVVEVYPSYACPSVWSAFRVDVILVCVTYVTEYSGQ